MNDKSIEDILVILERTYPNAECELKFNSSFELLVATILSAQATDKKVNEVTTALFNKYNSPEDFLALNQVELENEIKVIGLYRNKAKNILAMCHELLQKHNGQVPSTMEELTALPGVGRKTANVVLSNAFNEPAIAVDTHVFRVSNRIGLAKASNVLATEKELMANIPKVKWSLAHHLLIWHGRRICEARKPKCAICPVAHLCDYININEN